MIIEPIQAEGGDHHFRKEFLQALRKICDENEIILIYDEVQSGVGLTGKMWAFQHFVAPPDIYAFGKKTQVCGIAANNRVNDVDSVFKVESRINSTWGGNLIDMVRFQYYLEIIKEEKLVENATKMGAYLLNHLTEMQQEFPSLISNARGRGLMCAFDLPTPELRNTVRKKVYANGTIVLGCGSHTIRFRPNLNVTKEIIDRGMNDIHNALHHM
jgi:L-lysine 6-transaminase